MSFYKSACKLEPDNPSLNWWGFTGVTTRGEFGKALEYGTTYGDRCLDVSFATPEESFMFLLFVALSEGERFNRRPKVNKLVNDQKYLIQINCLTEYAMDLPKSARDPGAGGHYLPIGSEQIGKWDVNSMSVGPWYIGPADFSIIKKL